MNCGTEIKDYRGQFYPDSYIPMDPNYLYPQKYKVKDVYQRLPVLANNGQYFGTGLDDLMNQRSDIIHSKIDMLVSEIYERHKLRDESLYRIDVDQCSCRNLIFELGDHVWDKKRMELEQKIIDLEQEKRREKAGYFKDILFLRKELRESMIDDLEEKQKAYLFMNSGDELL